MSGFGSIQNLLKDDEEEESNVKKKKVDLDSTEVKFDKKMEEIQILDKEKIAMQKANSLGLPHVDLSQFPVSSEALRAIPEKDAKAKKAVCFYYSIEEIRLGCVESNEEIEELAYQLAERHHAQVGLYIISEHSLGRVLKLYDTLPKIKPIKKEINITDKELAKYQENVSDLTSISENFDKTSVTDLLVLLIASALKTNASDVHIESEEDGVKVRYRIDGILHDVAELHRDKLKKFISRIKLLASLKINIDDKPQDGRVTLRLSKDTLDVRVSTMPTTHGESVVMRILYGEYQGVNMDDLGIRGLSYSLLMREMERPNGMIITTGPTGSGKTTTLYAVLKKLNKEGVKVITLEDPIEIKMKGINQSQVDASKNYTFAKGLRSILRQDPDICMVGEIRDLETADIAIQAALTGHLMLSTIHTNSASGAIPRFLSMGVKPFLLAPALNAIMGQRLVRRICPHCIVEDELDSHKIERVGEIVAKMPEIERQKLDLDNLKFYKGAGCKECSGLGYKGRVGIYEIFIMNKEIENIILSGKVSEYIIEEIAIKNGMITMVQDGILKALDKVTSLEEVFRVAE